ncbi:Slp family lipoprotein [Nitrospira moscoviensis]|uniref:Putative Outer membrane lipoprotein, Slp family n=1 Tax=Nitrospira moscoviensis TaxID=42253 RepID=A0A0K2GEG7_NITMO|nr:Slp family lipoprotein [Nitrospira moscoviensis]ALA58987.1 putative Outer membrane lipoprotein, Slp family [Nitrospira moscoviensis]
MRKAAVCWGLLAVTVSVGGLAGCHRYQVIPTQLQAKVNRQLTFEDIKRDPARYQGETILVGGEVLRAVRLADRTKIEVLQLPLSSDLVPGMNRSSSQGRFIAFDQRSPMLDPATLEEGTRVTIVGEVQSPVSGSLDHGEYVYPTIVIQDLTRWDPQISAWPVAPLAWPYLSTFPHGFLPYTFWSGTRVTG